MNTLAYASAIGKLDSEIEKVKETYGKMLDKLRSYPSTADKRAIATMAARTAALHQVDLRMERLIDQIKHEL